MAAIAIVIFIALLGWGGSYYGWEDPDGMVRLALAASFLLGAISGFKARS